MKVTFDVSGLGGNQITGVGVYTTQLTEAIQVSNPQIELTSTYKFTRHKYRKHISNKIHLPFLIPYIPIIYNLYKSNFDIFHGTDFWIPQESSFKKVLTIHDLAIYHSAYYAPERRAYSIPIFEKVLLKHNPDHIIVVSNFIRNELIARFPQLAHKTSVVYHGCEHFTNFTGLKKTFEGPYIVCIGTIEARKNVLNLYHAFLIVKSKFPEIKLVFCGGAGGYQSEEIMREITSEKAIRNGVIYTGYVTDEQKSSILHYALMAVYPSFYEGFGFPIIEAMKAGVPVVTSSFGAMQEIAGDAALTTDTHNTEALANAMIEFIESSAKRNEFIAKGFEHTNLFSWSNCAKQTIQIYEQLI